jgi:TRAP-type mannitol/chloroaromatic compound transport system permease large subunit
MMLIVFLMGMFIDWAAILLITVPVFMPIAMELEFNPLWFSLLMCVNLQTSFLTPPFGYALFYFQGRCPGRLHHDAHLQRHHALCTAAGGQYCAAVPLPEPGDLAAGHFLRGLRRGR